MTDPHSASFERSLRLRYEAHQIGARGVGWFVLFFVISIGLVMLLVAWFLASLVQFEDTQDPPLSPLAQPEALPPEPRLQPSLGHSNMPWQDLARLRRQEDQTLRTYGWVDRAHGITRIPIDRALDIAIDQHLLDREAATQPHAQGDSP